MTKFHDIRCTSQKVAQRLRLVENLVYRRREPLQPFKLLKLASTEVNPATVVDVKANDWIDVQPNTYWVGPETNFLLKSECHVPPDWGTSSPIALYLPLGEAGDFSHPEALAYIDGASYAACDRYHQEILLPEALCEGRRHTLLLHGWSGGTHDLRFDVGLTGEVRTRAEQLLMGECGLVQIDQPTRDFLALARVALGTADWLPENKPARAHLYNALDKAFKALDTREPFELRFYDSVAGAHETLRKGVDAAGAPLDVTVTAAGHAHIDVAWLWTLSQTRRKAGRTFHNVLRLMEQFPEYSFMQSQPQLYDYVRRDYPQLFEGIQERVQCGAWEPIGGMWVEADCNLSGGESLAAVFSPMATHEIQWGNVQRPTHRNTSWDWARFETCAQKWVDLSEGDYGVSLLNDCKYGHDIQDNVMRLTLLRGSTSPDPTADLAEHHFVYSLLPHDGRWDECTIREAYALNDPLIVARSQNSGSQASFTPQREVRSFVTVDSPNVVLETIKWAEDGEGLIVCLYESQRMRGYYTLQTSFQLAAAWCTNLLEDNKGAVEVDGYLLRGYIEPYQIVTLRLLPAV